MEEVTLTEPEVLFYSDLFQRCDEEKTGKIPMLKAIELFRSANIANEVVIEIISLAGIPSAALHISRAQFYSCLKLIAAHQAGLSLRQELIVATVLLPLPRFIWQEADSLPGSLSSSSLPPPPTDQRNSLQRSSDALRRNSGQSQQMEQQNIDSEFHHEESNNSAKINNICTVANVGETRTSCSSSHELNSRVPDSCGSPEAWSTNSDSPTPTNSVAERPWAKESIWHCLIGEEHRQLLGTEEESSDRHTSDEDEHDSELLTLYQITPEQRDYYEKQFKAVQHDPNGLLSGSAARQFFEKSRIPIEELRHIWQLCDVTRDGALSLAEFTSAMHLVVLRRNNIPLPTTLPACLHPSVLQQFLHVQQEPPEADLLHLNDDDEVDKSEITVIQKNLSNTTRAVSKDSNIMNLSATSKSNTSPPAIPQSVKKISISNSPDDEPTSTPSNIPNVVGKTIEHTQDHWPTENLAKWTKFSESPAPIATSTNLKPALFDMKRTAQDVVSNPQILHPVPLRVTPVANALNAVPVANPVAEAGMQILDESQSKNALQTVLMATQQTVSQQHNHRDSIQNSDLRAIQRPQAKKLPVKNIGALPPPPQRESSIGATGGEYSAIGSGSNSNEPNNQHFLTNRKEPPPLPPPRPHRHTRSSSLDLNKLKSTTSNSQQPEMITQASFDLQMSTGFADFTQFPDDNNSADKLTEPNYELQQQSLPVVPTVVPATVSVASPSARVLLQSSQGVSAFEVYRKPNTVSDSQSPQEAAHPHPQQPTQPPPPAPTLEIYASGSRSQTTDIPNVDVFEKRVAAISETLRHVSFRQTDNTIPDVLRRLREQNALLLRLCNDLSDELLTVQTHKEEMRTKYEALIAAIASATINDISNAELVQTAAAAAAGGAVGTRTISSISAPVIANITGGSNGSAGTGSGAASHPINYSPK